MMPKESARKWQVIIFRNYQQKNIAATCGPHNVVIVLLVIHYFWALIFYEIKQCLHFLHPLVAQLNCIVFMQ